MMSMVPVLANRLADRASSCQPNRLFPISVIERAGGHGRKTSQSEAVVKRAGEAVKTAHKLKEPAAA